MPKRRHGAVDDSDDSEHVVSDASAPETASDADIGTPVTPRRRRLRGQSFEDDGQTVKNELEAEENGDGEMGWPVVLKTKKPNGQSLKRNKQSDDDDEYTESGSEQSSAASDSGPEKMEYSDGGFVVDSDENPLPSYSHRERRQRSRQKRRQQLEHAPKRRLRSRRYLKTRNNRSGSGSGSEEDTFSEGSVAEELRELHNQESPRRRNFRSRAPVDYAIPPPPTIEEVAQAAAIKAAERIDSASRARDAKLRRLFDVRGPFGGQDVVTLFGPTRAELEKLAAIGSEQSRGAQSNNNTSALVADVDPLSAGEGIDFSVVGGLDTYISKLKEMVSLPLLYPELYEKFGITPPRGVLFHGPPGTGKTLMARALAASHEQKVTFYMRKGADVLSKWIGESERQLRALFDEAKANQPAIIFFDEIDGLAPVRSAKQEQHHASIVSTLLALMDGMDKRGQVVVIGATNRPDSVDPALRRPGRFDREFYFPLPDLSARLKILEIHTRKWNPPPDPTFLTTIAEKTKGFGGADLQALTTEAALLAIQRIFPQIYGSTQKLAVDTSQLHVRSQDFVLALERAQPSTARGIDGGLAEPLPQRVSPLLRTAIAQIRDRVESQFPVASNKEDAQAALFLDEAAFSQALAVKQFAQQRIHRPRLLIRGPPGMGQSYLERAIANMLEGVYIRELGLSALFGNDSSTPEIAIVSAFSEARQRSPACLLLPRLEEWEGSSHLATLLEGLLRGLLPTEAVLVVGVASSDSEELPLLAFFGRETIDLKLDIDPEVLREYFAPLLAYIRRTPLETLEAHELPQLAPQPLPVADDATPRVGEEDRTGDVPMNTKPTSVFSDKERRDLRVRSQLKLKLGVLLDGFRTKYRRFRKPVVDEHNLIYLFEQASPAMGDSVDVESEQNYVRTENDMILDRTTGRKYFNMDLETVEDRLWNGYYSEAQQFLEDIEMIYRDAVELGDRERMHKASEMLANAQVAIDDINTDAAFSEACRKLRAYDAKERLKELSIKDQEELISELEGEADEDQPERSRLDVQVRPDEALEIASVNETGTVNDNGALPGSIAPSFNSQPDPSAPLSISNLVHTQPSLEQPSPAQPASAQPAPAQPALARPALGDEDAHPPFILNEELLAKFESSLVRTVANCTLEQLEQLGSILADVSWRHRLDWDRTTMLHTLHSKLLDMQNLSN